MVSMRKRIIRAQMKALRRILPVLTGALLLVVQPALACHCLEDLLPDARDTVVEDPSCNESPETRHADTRHGEYPQHGESPQCADCGDYEPAPAPYAAKAIASGHLPKFNPPPAIADRPFVSVRPGTVRSIGPPPAVVRAAQTPVLLKQRLLI